METLPFADQLTAKTKWSGELHKTRIRYGNTSASGTIGRDPRTVTVTLTWHLWPGQRAEWEDAFAPSFNGRFAYQCPERGWIALRPTDEYEWEDYGFIAEASMTFERVR